MHRRQAARRIRQRVSVPPLRPLRCWRWITVLVGSVILAAGLAPAVASASRPATAQERREIVAISQHIQRAPGSKSRVGVSDVRVTDDGLWALATVTLYYPPGPPDSAQAIYQRVRDHWIVTAHSPGTGYGMQCGIGMPVSAMRELGFGTSCPHAAALRPGSATAGRAFAASRQVPRLGRPWGHLIGMTSPSTARSASSAPCKDSLLFKAAQAAENFSTSHGYSHISPPGASEATCDDGWAVAAISRPNVGTTDGYTLFRSETSQWREVGQLGGSVATCQLKQYHVPNRVALVLAHGHVHSGIAGC